MILCVLGGVTDEAEREKGTQEGRKAETRFGKPDTSQGCEQWPCAQEASSQYGRKLCYVV